MAHQPAGTHPPAGAGGNDAVTGGKDAVGGVDVFSTSPNANCNWNRGWKPPTRPSCLPRPQACAAALAQFEQCQQILWDELGVEPEEETVTSLQQPEKRRKTIR
ncbi:MAG: bacterial transcriptional activator domain-containing protein [Chloroflexota bacterium]